MLLYYIINTRFFLLFVDDMKNVMSFIHEIFIYFNINKFAIYHYSFYYNLNHLLYQFNHLC